MDPEQFERLRDEFREFFAVMRESAERNASPWRDRKGAAAYLQCSLKTVDDLLAVGKLPRHLFLGRPRIAVKDLENLITTKRS